MTRLSDLVSALGPRDDETRVLGLATVIAVAGVIGHIDEDLEVKLALSRLSPQARAAATELVDAGCFTIDGDGRVWLDRLPTDGEMPLRRRALGLHTRYEQRYER